jgi:hypothetical protein
LNDCTYRCPSYSYRSLAFHQSYVGFRIVQLAPLNDLITTTGNVWRRTYWIHLLNYLLLIATDVCLEAVLTIL